MIRLTIPTLYDAAYIPKGKRSEVPVLMQGEHEVVLREITAEDAPIAHVIHDDYEIETRDFLNVFENEDGVPVRSMDGKFYVARWPVEEFVSAASVADWSGPCNGFYEAAGKNVRIGMQSAGERVTSRTRSEVEAKFGEIRKWIDNFAVTAAAIDRRSEDFIVVDGIVHELIGEPVIRLVEGKDPTLIVSEARKPETPFTRGASIHGSGLSFGIDQHARALEVAGELAAATGGTVRNHVRIDTVSPWAVRFRGEEAHLRRVAQRFAEFSTKSLRMTAMVSMAAYDLTTAVLENDGVTTRLVDALRKVHAALLVDTREFDEDGGPLPGWRRQHDDEDISKLVEDIGLALSIWDGRDHVGIEWVERGLDAPSTVTGKYLAQELLTLPRVDEFAIAIGAGQALEELADDASKGNTHLIAVEDENGPTAAALVRLEAGEPEIVAMVTRHGAAASMDLNAIVLEHAKNSRHKEADMAAALDDWGL